MSHARGDRVSARSGAMMSLAPREVMRRRPAKGGARRGAPSLTRRTVVGRRGAVARGLLLRGIALDTSAISIP